MAATWLGYRDSWPDILRRFGPVHLNVFDTLLGTARAFDGVVDGPIIAIDTHAGRIFISEPLTIAMVDARTGIISRFARFPPGSRPAEDYDVPPAAYAAEAGRLFVRRSLAVVDVFDVATSQLVTTISADSNRIAGIATRVRPPRWMLDEAHVDRAHGRSRR